MKIPEEFRQESESSGGSSSASSYCQYTKLSSGEGVVFSLLEEDPIFYFTVWGRSKASPNDPTQDRPFRFPKRPSEAEIEEELGSDYIQDVAFFKFFMKMGRRCSRWKLRVFRRGVNSFYGNSVVLGFERAIR